MTYLEFSPYWTVPSTILREDKLPAIQANPGYLVQKHHFRVIRKQASEWVEVDDLRRSTGRRSRPNISRVCCAWTPGRGTPSAGSSSCSPMVSTSTCTTPTSVVCSRTAVRSFSSGCIRVKHPVELALYLLRDSKGWDEAQAPRGTQPACTAPGRHRRRFRCISSTGRPGSSRTAKSQFRTDLYLRDLDLDVALEEPEPIGRPSSWWSKMAGDRVVLRLSDAVRR